MTEYKIFTDVHISKSKKVHVVCTDHFSKHRWHPTVMALLDELSDAGVREALIVGENKCFKILFDRAAPPKVVPLLHGHEGYQNKDAPADPTDATK